MTRDPSISVPPLGLGTWSVDGETCARTVERALECGYRHVDTAQLYGNEAAVGRGVASADVPREGVAVATKIDPERLGYDDAIASVHESRDRLGVDRIDLVYIHWPRAAYDPEATFAALADLVESSVVRAVGVSNFTPALLDEAERVADLPIAAHQVELHPLLPQPDLVADARERDIRLVAYSPLARGEALELPPVEAVAEKHDATPAQVCLAWLREKGVAAIPKATGDHVDENWRSLDLALAEDDIERIDAIDHERRLVDPPSAPWNRT